MSDYLHQKGYIYPLGRLTDEDNDAFCGLSDFVKQLKS